jgi:hypothetical protein
METGKGGCPTGEKMPSRRVSPGVTRAERCACAPCAGREDTASNFQLSVMGTLRQSSNRALPLLLDDGGMT